MNYAIIEVSAGRSGAIRRRDFLARLGDLGRIGFFGLVAAQWKAADARAAERTIMLDKVTVSRFRECLGTTFRLRSEAGQVDLELIEASSLGVEAREPGTSNRQAFSILFRGPAEPVLPQQIHALEHAALGRLDLFLVPIGPDAKGMRYEAVFN